MAEVGYLLSDGLYKDFLRMRGEAKRGLKNGPILRPQSPTSAPEIHVAVPPCGVGIPARTGDKPGHADCCIYKLTPIEEGDPDYDPATAPDRRLEPIAIDAEGNCQRLPVYNFSDFPVPARMPPHEQYISIAKSGTAWVCDPPDAGTTTTVRPGFNTGPERCTGSCKWTWDGVKWLLDENTCGSTTTTTTPAPGSTTTTTGAPCLCPTSTTSTTTSTCCPLPLPCHCPYPPRCGQVVGECYYSGCSSMAGSGVNHENLACTTTTCACPTTTTSFDPNASTTTTTCGPCDTTTTNCPCSSTTSSTTSILSQSMVGRS